MVRPSKLSEHKIHKGVAKTPFNDSFGDKLRLSIWADRLPEYIWLAIILKTYSRESGFEIISHFFSELKKNNKALCVAEFSKILSLEDEDQELFFKTLTKYIDPDILSPLTLLFDVNDYPIFMKLFLNPQIDIDDKINQLIDVIRINISFHSNEATDLNYIILWSLAYQEKIVFLKDLKITEALKNYHKLSHDNENMDLYRVMIRSACLMPDDLLPKKEFAEKFWYVLSELSKCNLYWMQHKTQGEKSMEYLEDIKDALNYLLVQNKELMHDDKFNVILGLSTYAMKIYTEIIENNLGNSLISRGAFRTAVEVYVLIKYLIKCGNTENRIWSMFQEYGIGKYKLVMAKLREGKFKPEIKHFNEKLMELLVNENKNEQFIDISFKYFDDTSIKDKFEAVGESELYETYYEYDTNFVHGLWGAIRESSLLHCDNPSHRYHKVPDINNEQKQIDIIPDFEMILNKMFMEINNLYKLPQRFTEKYGG